MEAAAAYFSALRPRKRIKVVESDTAPKTYIAAFLWAAAEGSEREPLGERIVADLLPATIPTDLMLRRGAEARQAWSAMAATALYEALTVWVMAAWPEQSVERVDVMVRTAMVTAVMAPPPSRGRRR